MSRATSTVTIQATRSKVIDAIVADAVVGDCSDEPKSSANAVSVKQNPLASKP